MLEKIESPADLRGLSIDQLKELANEIRDVIVRQVANKGGHLASSLGTVELTLALHKVYNTPVDKLIWDTGHQAPERTGDVSSQGRKNQHRMAENIASTPISLAGTKKKSKVKARKMA